MNRIALTLLAVTAFAPGQSAASDVADQVQAVASDGDIIFHQSQSSQAAAL